MKCPLPKVHLALKISLLQSLKQQFLDEDILFLPKMSDIVELQQDGKNAPPPLPPKTYKDGTKVPPRPPKTNKKEGLLLPAPSKANQEDATVPPLPPKAKQREAVLPPHPSKTSQQDIALVPCSSKNKLGAYHFTSTVRGNSIGILVRICCKRPPLPK